MEQESSRSVEKGFKDLANEEVEAFHYTRIMARVREKIERKNPMTVVKKRTVAVVGVVTVLFLSLLLIPASYSVRVGSVVKAEFILPDEGSCMPVLQALEGMNRLVNSNVSVNNENAEVTMTFKGDESPAATENNVKGALSAILPPDANLVLRSEAITQQRGGNALAAVTGGRITIGVERMSDQEMEAAIIARLEAEGVKVRNVSVKTDQVGEDQVSMEVRVEADAPEGYDGELPELPALEGIVPGADNGEGKRIEIRRVVKKD